MPCLVTAVSFIVTWGQYHDVRQMLFHSAFTGTATKPPVVTEGLAPIFSCKQSSHCLCLCEHSPSPPPPSHPCLSLQPPEEALMAGLALGSYTRQDVAQPLSVAHYVVFMGNNGALMLLWLNICFWNKCGWRTWEPYICQASGASGSPGLLLHSTCHWS